MKCGSFLLTIFMMFQTSATEVVVIQDLPSIKDAARQHALESITNDDSSPKRTVVTIGELDPRLRLTKCNANLIAFTPPGSRMQGNSTIGVRCNGPKRWSIYVSVKIAIYQQALVAINKLSRGQFIGIDDVKQQEVDISTIRGHSFTDINRVLGTKLKRSIQLNQVIDSAAICLVCKGDPVVISAGNQTVSVSMAGTALNDGSIGDKIRVQNNASRLILDATITNSGTVSVDI